LGAPVGFVVTGLAPAMADYAERVSAPSIMSIVFFKP
jgi:hypothetical protein